MQAINMPAKIIRREIENCGVLPFARFMELALYCPDYGYYETKKDIGRHGDFYTGVSVGELFGQLLAFQFAEWLEEFKPLNSEPATLNLIEAGAHNGRLANDILTWLQAHRPKLFEQIEYGILEPSPRRREWQNETLKNFTNVCWLTGFPNAGRHAPNPKFNGIIFSNELLDAMPVHRYGWDAKNKAWFEWGVAVEDKKFIWAKIQNPDAKPQTPDPALGEVLPDGYTIEVSPVAENWWREAANVLEQGRLLTFDYGLTADEMFSPGRAHGTLRAYFQHHITDDLLANAGEQDITAHVNFSAIQNVGEDAGLTTKYFDLQEKFLTGILATAIKDNSFRGWSAKQTRQFQTLTHPEHLGRAFRVFVQSR
jgi:SAM-dependent MidA family methyltransferase